MEYRDVQGIRVRRTIPSHFRTIINVEEDPRYQISMGFDSLGDSFGQLGISGESALEFIWKC